MTQDSDELRAALDLRVFMDRVEQVGELKVLRGAHWNLEIGALSEILADAHPPPAILFDDIVGYPKGFRVLSNVCNLAVEKRWFWDCLPKQKGSNY